MITNLFAPEPLIIARLRSEIPELQTVDSLAVLAGKKDITPLCPAVFVLPLGSEVLAQHGVSTRDAFTYEVQRWQLVLCVAYRKETSLAVQAGEFIVQTLERWPPSGDWAPLRYASRDDPYYEIGYGEFPLQFETRPRPQTL